MIPRHQPVPTLMTLATAQAGVVSREQAISLGVTPRVIERLLRDGLWRPVTSGIYSLGDPHDWLARAWAGVLIGGGSACLGHEAAAYLHRLLPEPPATITVHVDHAVQRDPRAGWAFVRSARRGRGEPPRTAIPDTILDLAPGLNEDALASLLSTAVGDRRTTPERILRALSERSRHPNRELLTAMLSDVASGAQSPLEVRYLREVERAHGLPVAARQAQLGRRYRTDCWYREFGVLVELDGRLHRSGGVVGQDLQRDNDHALLGQVTLRYGWPAVSGRPCAVARQVAVVLADRGWLGALTRCPRCRRFPDNG